MDVTYYVSNNGTAEEGDRHLVLIAKKGYRWMIFEDYGFNGTNAVSLAKIK